MDNAAWEKTEEELISEMIFGPFFDLQDVPFPSVRLFRRFNTWEQHGGAENPTVRLIDDALAGGRMVQERFPSLRCLNSRVTSKKHTNWFQRDQVGQALLYWGNGTRGNVVLVLSVFAQ